MIGSRFGQKGGDGPNKGKRATYYSVAMPDGTVEIVRSFTVNGETVIATGFMHNGKRHVCVWPGEPPWEGEFGRLVATIVAPEA